MGGEKKEKNKTSTKKNLSPSVIFVVINYSACVDRKSPSTLTTIFIKKHGIPFVNLVFPQFPPLGCFEWNHPLDLRDSNVYTWFSRWHSRERIFFSYHARLRYRPSVLSAWQTAGVVHFLQFRVAAKRVPCVPRSSRSSTIGRGKRKRWRGNALSRSRRRLRSRVLFLLWKKKRQVACYEWKL